MASAAPAAAFERAQQIAERQIAFAAHEEVDAGVGPFVLVRCEARVVASDHDPDVRLDLANQADELQRGAPLEGHHRKTDDLGIQVAHQPLDRALHRALNEDQIGNRHAMMPAHIAGDRRQRPVRHAHRQSGRVLERVRHGEQKNAHRSLATR